MCFQYCPVFSSAIVIPIVCQTLTAIHHCLLGERRVDDLHLVLWYRLALDASVAPLKSSFAVLALQRRGILDQRVLRGGRRDTRALRSVLCMLCSACLALGGGRV